MEFFKTHQKRRLELRRFYEPDVLRIQYQDKVVRQLIHDFQTRIVSIRCGHITDIAMTDQQYSENFVALRNVEMSRHMAVLVRKIH